MENPPSNTVISWAAKIRQLAHLEYCVEHDVETAVKNIRRVFGYHSIDMTKVRQLFDRFTEKKSSKFIDGETHNTEMTKHLPRGTQMFMHGSISQINLNYICKMVNTFDGRIGFAALLDKFVVVDMFHGETRSVLFSFSNYVCQPLEFVDETRFLVFNSWKHKLSLYKFVYDTMALETLHEVRFTVDYRGGYLILDALDLTKFAIYIRGNGGVLCTGHVVGDQIVIGKRITLNVGIEWARLHDSKLRFFSKISSTSCKLYDVNLETKKFKLVDVLTTFSDGKCFNLKDSETLYSSYFWSKRGFYVACKSEGSLWKIAVLSFKTREWFDTGIEIYNKFWKLFVDKNEVLTAVAENPFTNATTFYRYSLRKPDSLVNLAWFSYTQEFKKTGKRGKLFDHIPYTCEVRLQLPEIENNDVIVVEDSE